jgi:ADP-ribose pyrophosphatase YjhB (NUDIX family)
MKELAGKSEVKVDQLIDDLKERYGDFQVSEKTWEVSPEGHEKEAENFRNGGYGGAGIWLTNDRGQVLLVKNKGDDSWGDPGGHHENEEKYEEAAIRETREEANVEAEITGIQSVDKVKFQDKENYRHFYNLLVIFKGEYLSGTPKPQQEEIEEVKWWDDHPENLLYEDFKHFTIPSSN